MEEEQMNTLFIIGCGLEQDRDKVFVHQNSDESLVKFSHEHKQKLINDGDEIFEHIDNILITSSGYYIAIFKSLLENKFKVID